MDTTTETSEPTTLALEIKRVLLVDDDSELAAALKELLEYHNFVVTTMDHGAEALREIIDLDFDVIICDLMMPHMRGDLFYLGVRKLKPELAKRFIFMTGHIENPVLQGFLESTAVPVLSKPVIIDDLISQIGLVLQESKANPVEEEDVPPFDGGHVGFTEKCDHG